MFDLSNVGHHPRVEPLYNHVLFFLAMHHTKILNAGITCRKLTQCNHVALHVCIADHFPVPTNAGRHFGGPVSLFKRLFKTPWRSALKKSSEAKAAAL